MSTELRAELWNPKLGIQRTLLKGGEKLPGPGNTDLLVGDGSA